MLVFAFPFHGFHGSKLKSPGLYSKGIYPLSYLAGSNSALKIDFFLSLMSPPPCSLCMVYACMYLKAVFKNSYSPCSVASAALILEVELPSLDLDIFG